MENAMQEFKADELSVKIFPSRLAMGKSAAVKVSEKIKELLKSQDFVNIIFASAPSQNEFLEALLVDETINWSKVRAFHMDEYIGLPGNAPQSFGNFLKVRLFDKVPIHAVFYLDGNNADMLSEANRYADLLKKYPTDIVCMGIGENCHLAFNDPHVAFFNDQAIVKTVELDRPCRQQQVNDGCFSTFDAVPTHALTVTIPALVSATFVFCIVPGNNKAAAVKHTIEDTVQEAYPSTVLRKHPQTILFIDQDSAGKLTNLSSL